MLYTIIKFLSKKGFPIYFKQLEINGKENIPHGKPYILAPNHQNAFMDAVLTAAQCRTPVHFLTRSDVFVKPYDVILKALNMMPVYRLRDGYEKLKKNDEIFAYCYDLLKSGKPVLIFPEGNMGPGHSLRPLTKGTARMAFRAQEEIDDDLLILPVGINYFHHDNPRCKANLNFGKPIRVRDYQSRYDKHKAKGLIALKNDLFSAIHKLMVIPDLNDQYDERVNRLNRKNEHLNFKQLKGELENFSALPVAKPISSKFNWLTQVLSIPNFAPLILLNKIISGLEDEQFTGSLKFFIGLLAFPFWWLLITALTWWLQGAVVAAIVLAISVNALFIRSEIKKRLR